MRETAWNDDVVHSGEFDCANVQRIVLLKVHGAGGTGNLEPRLLRQQLLRRPVLLQTRPSYSISINGNALQLEPVPTPTLALCVMDRTTQLVFDLPGLSEEQLQRAEETTSWIDRGVLASFAGSLQVSRCVLLEGASGSGKTSLMRATAQRLGWRLLEVRAGRVESAAHLRARLLLSLALPPCVVLLDDLDMLCPRGQTDDDDGIHKELLTFLALLPSTAQLAVVGVCSRSDSVAAPVAAAFACVALPPLPASQRLALVTQRLPGLSHTQAQQVSDRLAGLALVACIARTARPLLPAAAPPLALTLVAGHVDVKQQLQELLAWPRVHAALFARLKLHSPLGLLLFGPPGTGKTLLVKSLARELQCSFIDIRLTDVVRGYIGQGEGALRDNFAEARRLSPCIVFIDEFQAAFSSEGGSLSVGLASCLDDVAAWNQHSGADAQVTVVAATNEPWAIHASFLRAGRLERAVFVGPLDAAGREHMLQAFATSPQPSALRRAVEKTEGFTGADMELLFKTARTRLAEGREDAWLALEDAMKTARASTDPIDLLQYQRWNQGR